MTLLFILLTWLTLQVPLAILTGKHLKHIDAQHTHAVDPPSH